MTARPIAPLAALLLSAPLLAQASADTPAQQAAPKPAAPAPKAAPAPRQATTASPAPRRVTPPAERTAVIGVLDKRLGTTAEFTLKPGERFSFGRISGILRGCEKTQPFERPQSGAFVQVVERPLTLQGQPQAPLKTVFSGWLFAESPSLNPFVHPVYDVWLKSCTMRFPDGPRPAGSAGGTSARPRPARAPAATPEAAAPAPAAPAATAPQPATPAPTTPPPATPES